MFAKNERTEAAITDLTRDGEGIGRAEGCTLFVKDALPGDRVLAHITRPKKTYAYARTERILSPSPDRVEAACPEARRCGGCRLQELRYEAQLAFKEKLVRDALVRIGGFPEPPMKGIVGMEEPFRYRNKAQYPIGMVKGKLTAGFYVSRTHDIIPVSDCLLTREVNAEILRIFLEFLKEYRISAYDEQTGAGLVRHLLIREGFSTGQILVCPVISGSSLPKSGVLVERLRVIPGITSICLNVNTSRGNVILGQKVIPLFGDPWIEDELDGLRFRISPLSFYQVNPVQTVRLYRAALEAAGLTGQETVFDLYCGIGTISLFLARKAKEVCGVEIVPDAIRDAKENAARNGICNARFYTGAAEELVSRGCFEQGVPIPRADVVVVDPPRKGCDPALLEAILRMEPDRVVYVSCDPATLARDLKTLCADGRYALRSAQPFDMFSQSCHTECVVKLVRQEPGADRE